MTGVAAARTTKNAEALGSDVQAFRRSSPSPAVPRENPNSAKHSGQISRGAGQSPAWPLGQDTPLTHDDVMRHNTGWQQSPEHWRENQLQRAKLSKQTCRLADALETAGIPARLSEMKVAELGEVTGLEADKANYRSICFLPEIAQRERRPILSAISYFLRGHAKGQYLRYAVVTSGERVPLGGPLRHRAQRLSKSISRWASDAEKKFGVVVVFRGTEWTIDDDKSFHVHANVLYFPRRRLNAREWARFLSWTKQRLGGVHWRDCGLLEKPQEAVKYPFKPLDLEKLEDDPQALAWLFNETYGLKIAQPMRDLKEFRRTLKENRRKLVMVNRRDGARLEIVSKQERDPRDDDQPPFDPNGENLLLNRSLPRSQFTPWAEPVTRVANFTTEPKTHAGAKRLEIIRTRQREAREFWDANGAPDPEIAIAVAQGRISAADGEAGKVAAFNVHTRRTTAQVEKKGNGLRSRLARRTQSDGPEKRTVLDDGTVFDSDTGELREKPPLANGAKTRFVRRPLTRAVYRSFRPSQTPSPFDKSGNVR